MSLLNIAVYKPPTSRPRIFAYRLLVTNDCFNRMWNTLCETKYEETKEDSVYTLAITVFVVEVFCGTHPSVLV